MRVLITGGAGYIGSHTVKALGEAGHTILTVDNLSSGHKEALLYGRLIRGNVGSKELMREIVRDFKPDAVIHFAASIEVGESVREPKKFYQNNTINTVNLLSVLVEEGVDKFVFSSTAAVYGIPKVVPIPEEHPTEPINPYGNTKLCSELALKDFSSAYGLKFVSLRYFNAAGAEPEARIGESHEPETHLIPLVLKAAKGERESVKLFGTDYPTPDGTCIRDFIHVCDLADAHLLALEYLMSGGESSIFNCGYGRGHSVLEVIESARRITGRNIKVEHAPRREGDPPVLVADSRRLRSELNWRPRYDDLDFIIETAWKWELNRRF